MNRNGLTRLTAERTIGGVASMNKIDWLDVFLHILAAAVAMGASWLGLWGAMVFALAFSVFVYIETEKMMIALIMPFIYLALHGLGPLVMAGGILGFFLGREAAQQEDKGNPIWPWHWSLQKHLEVWPAAGAAFGLALLMMP